MKKILIIEDTREYAESLEFLLAREGFKVLRAENGKEGVKKAVSERPDLILMDILMPEQDGVEAAGHIREHESLRQVPLLFLTSATGGDDVLVSVNGYSYPAVSKLLDCDKLLVRIKQSLSL